MSNVIVRGSRDTAHFKRRLSRKMVKRTMKETWQASRREQLRIVRERLDALVGPPDSFPTHADYMAAVRFALVLERVANAGDTVSHSMLEMRERVDALAADVDVARAQLARMGGVA